MCQAVAITESSPRLEVMTSPSTHTVSPMSTSDFQDSSASSPMFARDSMAWISSPAPDRKVAKHSLPVLRMNMIRPATPTVTPVAASIPSSPCCARMLAMVVVTGTRTGYASAPLAINRSRLSRRTSICSGRSSTSGSVVTGDSVVTACNPSRCKRGSRCPTQARMRSNHVCREHADTQSDG